MPKNRLRFLALLLPGAGLLATGCGGYTSEYVPPQDGRPRLLWQDNKVVPVIANGVPQSCTDAVGEISGGAESRPLRGHGGGGTYYVPVRTVVVVNVHGPGFIPVPRPLLPPLLPGSSGIGKLGGGGGGSGDMGKAAVVVAVVALLVLPFVAIGLATGRPEPESEVALAIDRVNAQTDLARVEGSPCDELVVAGQEEAQ